MAKPTYELADVLRENKQAFITTYKLHSHQLRVLNAIEQCRTPALGGHIDKCDTCNHIRISYNSCRNRHCPKCQGVQRERWIVEREKDLLPVNYYHVVFTLPEELNHYCLQTPEKLYNMLFSASKETIEVFSRDPKHLGAEPGMISILHTWGQNLSLHPHVHMIVPGGGIGKFGEWVQSKNAGNYLFPGMAMAVVFKNKILEKLLFYLKGKGQVMPEAMRKSLYKKNWVVYCKQPFMGVKQVLEYLGRYTHKIAISNHRLKSINNGYVSFLYKDYKHKGQQKIMQLEATEFLRRFCLHILPPGFRKIRHYGILANRNKQEIRCLQEQFEVPQTLPGKQDWKSICRERINFDVEACPCCKNGRMQRIMSFDANAPPLSFYNDLIKNKKMTIN